MLLILFLAITYANRVPDKEDQIVFSEASEIEYIQNAGKRNLENNKIVTSSEDESEAEEQDLDKKDERYVENTPSLVYLGGVYNV